MLEVVEEQVYEESQNLRRIEHRVELPYYAGKVCLRLPAVSQCFEVLYAHRFRL